MEFIMVGGAARHNPPSHLRRAKSGAIPSTPHTHSPSPQDYLSRLNASAAAVVSRRCAGLAAAGVTHYSTELPRLTVPRSAAAIAQASSRSA